MQVWAVTLFCIGLTILSVGYIIVEIFFWDKYPWVLKGSLERNKRYRLDRVIHYMIWWVVSNLVTILFLSLFVWWENIFNRFNEFWILATKLASRNPVIILNIQLVLFSVVWFFIILLLPLTMYLIYNLYLYIIRNDGYVIRNLWSYFKREKVKKKK